MWEYSKDTKMINLTCEYRTDPLGMDSEKPVLALNINSVQKNISQVVYRILVSDILEKKTSEMLGIPKQLNQTRVFRFLMRHEK